MRVGVVFDSWKLPIFKNHFKAANITNFVVASDAPPKAIAWIIESADQQYLMKVTKVVYDANHEAKTTGPGVGCKNHFPVSEFVWDGTNEKVGS